MSTITDSLKNFYKKLGGSLSNLGPNSTSADIVDAMAEVYTDKEGTYVEVTEAVTEGTKIATIKTNNVDHDIFAPVELPAVTSADEGKVLSIDSNGAWTADDVPTELPAVTSADEGKVLTVDGNGDWAADDVPSELPTVTSSDEGKILAVDGNGDWGAANAPVELPTVTSADEGKILSVDSNGDWTADDVPTELPAVTSADEGKVLSVDSNGDWVADSRNVLIIPAGKVSNYITFQKTIGEINTDIRNACTPTAPADVIIITFNQHDDAMMFRCSQINSDSIEFCNILRLPTSTAYTYFSIPTTGTGNTVTFTETIVNDPA